MESQLADYLGQDAVLTEEELLKQFLGRKVQTLSASNTAAIVRLLGGIDVVMTSVLETSTLLGGAMSIEDRKEMQRYLNQLDQSNVEATSFHTEASDIIAVPRETDDPIENEKHPKWTLITNNNLLYDKYPWIHDHLYSNWLMLFFGLFASVSAILYLLLDAADISINVIFLLFPILAWFSIIPWSIAVLLSVNRAMISEIASTADTWIKAIMGMLIGIYSALHISSSEEFADVPLSINIVRNVTLSLLFCTFLLVVSSLDGLQGWKRYSKIFWVMAMALFCAGWFAYFQYFAEANQMETMFGTISITARAAQAFEVLLIFLCKHAVNTWRKRDGECVVVRSSPCIEWREALPKSVDTTTDEAKDN